MPDNTAPQIESIGQLQSSTIKNLIGVAVAAIMPVIVSFATLIGHPLDVETQLKLTQFMLSLGGLASLYFAWRAYRGRMNTNTVIAGSKGELAVLAQGGTVTPKSPPDSTSS